MAGGTRPPGIGTGHRRASRHSPRRRGLVCRLGQVGYAGSIDRVIFGQTRRSEPGNHGGEVRFMGAPLSAGRASGTRPRLLVRGNARGREASRRGDREADVCAGRGRGRRRAPPGLAERGVQRRAALRECHCRGHCRSHYRSHCRSHWRSDCWGHCLPHARHSPQRRPPLMPPTAPLGYYWGDDSYGVNHAPDALAKWLAGDGPPLDCLRLSGSGSGATSAAEIAEKVATATMFGGGTLVVVSEPAGLVSSKPLAAKLTDAIASVAPGNGLAFLDSVDGTARRPASLEALRKSIVEAGGHVQEFVAPTRDQMARWIGDRAKERDIRIAPAAAALLAERVGANVKERDVDRRRQGELASNIWCPRLTAAMILAGSAVQVKGFGLALCSTTKRLIAACKSTTDRKMARFNRRFVSLAKKPSTALSQDADVGVKWNVQRGCRASHWRTFGCLWVA